MVIPHLISNTTAYTGYTKQIVKEQGNLVTYRLAMLPPDGCNVLRVIACVNTKFH
ncbi:hypothetical protein P4331_6 [Escherichia phage vB_EcolP_P433.1]|uniref:Uncharacterized protein n=1 Tax=Escherichia phage vB_EcolP_P433.1 TaxID=2653657 RepID=A0AAE6P090_9CAUD|nr:hypothetical protein P4331_6 [Escherichia phage vB_EcolP_P433.1]